MARGPKTKHSPVQTAYLESHLPEFLAKQPNLATFWPTVERGYFALWPEEPNLGLPIADRSIEDSGLMDAEQKLLGNTETKTTGKQKRLMNASASSSAASTAMEQLMSALLGGTGGKRKKQAWEIWQKRNGSLIKAALAEADFASLMPPPVPSETKKQAADRVAEGARQQMIVRRRIEKELFEEASDGEMDEVHKIYVLQMVEKAVPTKSEMPEEFQKGLDNLDPLMKTFHGLVTHLTGWVGTTMLTGPMPRANSQIATQSYCHGTTPSGHSMAESVSSWNEGFLVPLQQFGKKFSITKLVSNPGCSTGDIAIDPVLLEISSPDNIAIDPFLLQDQCSPLHAEQHSGLLNANVPPSALTPDDFPESRPMSNAPVAPVARREAGTGPARGGKHGGKRGGKRGRSGGCGGNRGVGHGRVGNDDGEDIPESTGVTCSVPTPQAETMSPECMREIRVWEREHDAAAARAAHDRDHSVFYMPPPPPAHKPLLREPAALGARPIPAEPAALGARRIPVEPEVLAPWESRVRRPSTRMQEELTRQKEEEMAKVAKGKKRAKSDSENQAPRKKKKDYLVCQEKERAAQPALFRFMNYTICVLMAYKLPMEKNSTPPASACPSFGIRAWNVESQEISE
ncbi:hypothetical protein B0H14DRAFT_2599290 [Mycena olivaceomarginata]|nr:hypothetical protein B0H14DRAFT_2599290 [Mycena olivaceomarginata]